MSSNPELLPKDRLKGDLKKHGVTFGQHDTKDVLVQLYRKHITRGKGRAEQRTEFSSDEEFVKQHSSRQQSRKQATPTRRPVKVKADTYMSDVVALSDEELLEQLRAYGKDPGPIVDTTRSVYQKQLAKLIAEQTVSKSASREAAQQETEEEEEEEEEGADANVSYIGEWSSDEEAEEIEVQPSPPRRMETRQSSKVQVHVSKTRRSMPSKESVRQRAEPRVRERVVHQEDHRRPMMAVGESRREPARQQERKKHRSPPSPASSGSFLLSFCLLVLIIVAVFLAYDYYTMGDSSVAVTGVAYFKENFLKTAPTAPADKGDAPPGE